MNFMYYNSAVLIHEIHEFYYVYIYIYKMKIDVELLSSRLF